VIRLETLVKKPFVVAPIFLALVLLTPAFSTHGDVAAATTTIGTTFVVPSSIDATGTFDVTDQLNRWIATQTSDGTADARNRIVFNGMFRVEYGLKIGTVNPSISWPYFPPYTRNHVVIDLTNATLVQRDPTPYSTVKRPGQKRVTTEFRKRWGVSLIKIMGGQDIEVLGGLLQSTNAVGTYSPAREAWHGVTIVGTDGVELVDMHIAGVWGDFVYITPRGRVLAHDVVISGGKFERNGRQGITMNGVDGLQITGVEFRNVQRVLFDHEPFANGGLTNVNIHNCFGNSGGLGFVNLRPLKITPLHDISIQDNRFGRWLRMWISTKGAPRSNVLITDNTALTS
jgi:hypothetical protein